MNEEQVSKKFSFSTALRLLKTRRGVVVTRNGWNNPTIRVKLQTPNENSKMTMPYLYMEKTKPNTDDNAQNPPKIDRFPLDLSCESILANDWVEIEMGM